MELLKLSVIFILIIIALGCKLPLHAVMFGATVLLGLFFVIPPVQWLEFFASSLTSAGTAEVVLVVWAVMLLEGLMSVNGYMKKMMDAMTQLFHSTRINLITLPMLIGFLPSAGGALFSAPLLDEAAKDTVLSGQTKAMINAYYRHVMEIFFPTYPSIIIISQIAGVPLASLSLILLPCAIVTLLLGLWMIRKVPKEKTGVKDAPLLRRIANFLLSMWPFLILIIMITALDIKVYLACLITLAALIIVTKMPLSQFPKLIREQTKWRLLVIILCVMAFKDVLLASGAVDNLSKTISLLPIPSIMVFSFMALFIGMITGVAYSPSGIVMPLVVVAIPEYTLATVACIQISGYLGCQLTPTHLCIPLSAEFFKANMQRVIFGYLPLYAIIYVLSLLIYGFLLG